MKKSLSIMLTLIMTLALTTPALAADNNQPVSEKTYYNEYDYILSIEQASSEELAELGLTKEQANKIVSTFETALRERAALPEETLLGYGYTQDEISALHTYNTRSTLPVDTMRAITGTCTGQITASWMTEREATFRYDWRWDHAPIMKLGDSVAIRWLAYDVNANVVDVYKSSYSSNINYYWNGAKRFSLSGSWEPNLEFNSLNLQFNEGEHFQSSTTITEEAFAGDGYVKVSIKLEPGVIRSIDYVRVAALYGHTTIGPNFPSISLSLPLSLSISFDGNTLIDPIAPAQVSIHIGSSSSKPIIYDRS